MTDYVFSEKLPILRFRILTAVNMWKNAFFYHHLASEGWYWLKVALNDVFITMKWLLTCFECICSFLLSLCANKRLYIAGMQIFLQLQEFLQFQNKFFDFLQFQKLELWIEDIEKWPVALFMHWNGVFWASRHTKIYKISGTTHLAPARTRWCRFAPVLSCKFILSYLHPCCYGYYGWTTFY